MMSFDKRMSKRAEKISSEISNEVRRALSISFEDFSEKDWDDIYSTMDIRCYLIPKDGKLTIEVSYSDWEKDRKFFDLSDIVDTTIEYHSDASNVHFERWADQLELMAGKMRTHIEQRNL